MFLRNVQSQVIGRPASDGAGVRLTRVFGGQGLPRLDPFLMLDEFDSADANDYIAGFPAHPHRGFETVTYMLEGRMLHEDHLGNQGLLQNGGAQWMTAAHGIIHSEMPQQVEGRMRGFQLWVNLPASEKMGPAGYRDLGPEELGHGTLADGSRITVIAGRFDDGQQHIDGPIQGKSTEPVFIDLELAAGASTTPRLPRSHTVLMYVYEGAVTVKSQDGETVLPKGRLALFGDGDAVALDSLSGGRALLLAGKPLREPIVQYGPFVMNSHDEIEQALRDYRDGVFAG